MHKNYYIDGYFQSEKYFEDIKDIILQEFKLKNEKEISQTKLFKSITENDLTCISVRRGDYVTNKGYIKYFMYVMRIILIMH